MRLILITGRHAILRGFSDTERALLLSINKPIFGCNEGIGSPILERRHPNFGRGGQPNYVVSNCFKPSAGGRRSIERAGISARALIVTRFIVLWLMEGGRRGALGRLVVV